MFRFFSRSPRSIDLQSESEQLLLYRKCQELAASELSLRSQLTVYAERYQEFQNAIEQSNQMVTSCDTQIQKMQEKIKRLEQERNEFRQRWEAAEANQRKTNDDVREKHFFYNTFGFF